MTKKCLSFTSVKQLFMVIFLLVSCLTYSQVTLEGTIPDYAEQPVRIIQYQDYFTYKEILIKTVNTNKDGIFKVQFPFLKEFNENGVLLSGNL